ncbi:MAG: hypothetical protein H5U20_04065 [Rhodobacteraceae bacterium]|nr:hypothetical protein [Paracoccaceae bacterium]
MSFAPIFAAHHWKPQHLFRAAPAGAIHDPSDLSSLWQDTAGTVPAVVGQAVARIDDLSGNGNHATQATVAKQPILRTAGGLLYLDFDGIDDAMQTGVVSWGGATAVSVLAAAHKTSSATAMLLESGPDANTTAGTFFLTLPINTTHGDRFNVRGASAFRYANQVNIAPFTGIYSAVWDFGTDAFSARSNGVAMSTITGGTFGGGAMSDQILYLGARAGSSIPFQGRFYGAILVGRALSTSEVAQAEAWLANKAGVTL